MKKIENSKKHDVIAKILDLGVAVFIYWIQNDNFQFGA